MSRLIAAIKRLSLLRIMAGSSLIALIMVCLAWEGWLAPLRPGGSWLILKAVPLLLPLHGIIHGRRYTSEELCRRITGRGLDFGSFMNYVQDKYADVYDIS